MSDERNITFFNRCNDTVKILRHDKSTGEQGQPRAWGKREEDLLNKLITYINSGNWTSSRNYKEFLHNLRYQAVQLAKMNGKSESSIRSQRSQISSKLTSIVGEDVFDIILYGTDIQRKDLDLKLDILIKGSINVSDLFFDEVAFMLADLNENSKYSLEACEDEICILARLSKFAVDNILNMADKKKLKSLYDILLEPDIIKDDFGKMIMNKKKITIIKQMKEVLAEESEYLTE